ncbi:MAG: efflux RND transporter permease subunit [Sphingomonadaceae bacterium]|nr:efflux RND transporter permease subunit [Sphingomonadaceae bacterium]
MSFRNISAWAIRNPVAPIVLFVALTIAGIVSFMSMQVNQDPDISFPAATVEVDQPGAAPTEMETQVTQRIEAAVRGISGVDEITSKVTEGESYTIVQFAIGTPVDRAVNDVRDAVSQIRSQLPEGILEPRVSRLDIADSGPLAYYSVQSTSMTLEQLSWFVDNTISKKLLAISGMAQVKRSGGVSREIRVVLDPARMQAQGVTAAQVNAQLRLMNMNAAGGRAEIAGAEQSVRVLGNAQDAYALGQKQIALADGRTIKLADIADVRDAYAEQRNVSKLNGRQVLSFSASKAKGASDVTVYDDMQKALRDLAKQYPQVSFKQLYTSVDYTKVQYDAALHAIIEGAVLAVAVVFLFLRDWRATAISALAIPLSAIPTFFFMSVMGFTLNSLSLLALSLVAGVLVDDAIVEIENIVRHMRMGKSAYQAAIDAADEIGLAVVATTFSIVAVFLPVGLMPGVSGQFFKNFGLTVVAAVLMSLAVARLITPMISAYFLRAHGEAPHGQSRLLYRYLDLLRWSLDTRRADAYRAVHGGWRRLLGYLRDHRIWTIGIGVAAFFLTIAAFATLPFQFQPPLDFDFSQVDVQMVPGSTKEDTVRVADETQLILSRQPEVSDVVADIDVGSANLFLTLRKDRKRTETQFERDTSPLLATIPDARVNFQSQNSNFGRDVSVVLVGDDPKLLDDTARQVVKEMATLSEIRAPRVDSDLPRPEITIRPHFDMASQMGVTTEALSTTIRIATLGDIDQNVAKFSLSDRQIPIRVVINENSRRSLATIQNLPVPTTSGGSVPLKVVADIGFGAGPSQIRRYNQSRRAIIGADFAPGLVGGAAKQIDALPTLKHLPNGVQRVYMGQDKWQGEMISNFIVAVISGVLLVFAVLVLLYKRVMPPLVNMGSLVLAPLGGALALHLTGMAVSMPVFIGLLMLLGIVAKNSILLVDFAIEEMHKGTAKIDAIMEAGHKRAQPIIMTTVAMVAGMVPVAFSLSGDGSFRAPMAITVIGGLLASTLLTLVIVPAAFSVADDIERWLGGHLGRVLTNGGANAPAPEAQPAE